MHCSRVEGLRTAVTIVVRRDNGSIRQLRLRILCWAHSEIKRTIRIDDQFRGDIC
jgi:hypothetical protein